MYTRRTARGDDLFRLDRHSNGLAAPEAQRCNAALQAAVLESVDQCGENARPACAQWMTESDGPAIDVYALPIPTLVGEQVAVRQDLRGEGLIELDQVHVCQFPVYLLQQLGDGTCRGSKQ